ncbi:hypothetical protein DIPPA_34424 [Diplonema papillatum]|nr:hypothetical protein DIPPA_34424 [Diplonema papillatum]
MPPRVRFLLEGGRLVRPGEPEGRGDWRMARPELAAPAGVPGWTRMSRGSTPPPHMATRGSTPRAGTDRAVFRSPTPMPAIPAYSGSTSPPPPATAAALRTPDPSLLSGPASSAKGRRILYSPASYSAQAPSAFNSAAGHSSGGYSSSSYVYAEHHSHLPQQPASTGRRPAHSYARHAGGRSPPPRSSYTPPAAYDSRAAHMEAVYGSKAPGLPVHHGRLRVS